MINEAERLRAEVARMTGRVEHELASSERVSRETKRERAGNKIIIKKIFSIEVFYLTGKFHLELFSIEVGN